VQAALGDLAANEGAELAVHGRPDLVVVLEGEADAVDAGGRHEGGEDEAGEGEELEGAGAELAQHVGVGAELVVREELDLEPPVRGVQDPVRRLLGADVERVHDGRVVGVLVAELGRLGWAGADAEQG
jgi:hypothetical protein